MTGRRAAIQASGASPQEQLKSKVSHLIAIRKVGTYGIAVEVDFIASRAEVLAWKHFHHRREQLVSKLDCLQVFR